MLSGPTAVGTMWTATTSGNTRIHLLPTSEATWVETGGSKNAGHVPYQGFGVWRSCDGALVGDPVGLGHPPRSFSVGYLGCVRGGWRAVRSRRYGLRQVVAPSACPCQQLQLKTDVLSGPRLSHSHSASDTSPGSSTRLRPEPPCATARSRTTRGATEEQPLYHRRPRILQGRPVLAWT